MPDSYGGFGGIAQYNRDLLDALAGLSVVDSIVSVTRNPADTGYVVPAKLTEILQSGSPVLYSLRAIREALRFHPTLILCGHFNLLPVAVMIKRITGAPIILEAYGIEAWRQDSTVRLSTVNNVDWVISISRFTREQLIGWSGIDPNKIKVIPNAVHLSQYNSSSKPTYLIKRYGLEGKRVLLTIGRLPGNERYKGHDRVINLLNRLSREMPDLLYLIVGDGTDRPRLEELVRRTGNEERVVFAGRIPESEKVDHYNVSDAFAMPSLSEGFGFVFLEAAACGLPVLGGNKDGSRDALLDGAIGVLVDPENSEELFDGLLKILKAGRHVPDGLEAFSFNRFSTQVQETVIELNRLRNMTQASAATALL